jgi:hypothetical protein
VTHRRRTMTPQHYSLLAIGITAVCVAVAGATDCLVRWGLVGCLALVIVSCTLAAIAAFWLILDHRAARYDHAFLLGYQLREIDDREDPPAATKLHLIDLSS